MGRHQGIIHYTVGQRRGLGVASGAPLYVVALDPDTRRVVVGPRDALRTRRIHLRDVNWIGKGSVETAAAEGREVPRQGALDARAAAGVAAPDETGIEVSNWLTARRACRPVRPACSTTPPTGRPACSAAASSSARRARRCVARASHDARRRSRSSIRG